MSCIAHAPWLNESCDNSGTIDKIDKIDGNKSDTNKTSQYESYLGARVFIVSHSNPISITGKILATARCDNGIVEIGLALLIAAARVTVDNVQREPQPGGEVNTKHNVSEQANSNNPDNIISAQLLLLSLPDVILHKLDILHANCTSTSAYGNIAGIGVTARDICGCYVIVLLFACKMKEFIDYIRDEKDISHWNWNLISKIVINAIVKSEITRLNATQAIIKDTINCYTYFDDYQSSGCSSGYGAPYDTFNNKFNVSHKDGGRVVIDRNLITSDAYDNILRWAVQNSYDSEALTFSFELVDTLSTPSYDVQYAIGDSLVYLIRTPVLKLREKEYVNHLIQMLTQGTTFPERKGEMKEVIQHHIVFCQQVLKNKKQRLKSMLIIQWIMFYCMSFYNALFHGLIEFLFVLLVLIMVMASLKSMLIETFHYQDLKLSDIVEYEMKIKINDNTLYATITIFIAFAMIGLALSIQAREGEHYVKFIFYFLQ